MGAIALERLGANLALLESEVMELLNGLSALTGVSPVLEWASEEALALGDDHVGSEHLVLALMRVKSGPAAAALGRLGLTYGQVLKEIRKLRA